MQWMNDCDDVTVFMYMHLASFRGPGHDWQAPGTEQVSHKCALNRQGTNAVIADQKHTACQAWY